FLRRANTPLQVRALAIKIEVGLAKFIQDARRVETASSSRWQGCLNGHRDRGSPVRTSSVSRRQHCIAMSSWVGDVAVPRSRPPTSLRLGNPDSALRRLRARRRATPLPRDRKRSTAQCRCRAVEADEGCDYDFLATGNHTPTPAPEIH